MVFYAYNMYTDIFIPCLNKVYVYVYEAVLGLTLHGARSFEDKATFKAIVQQGASFSEYQLYYSPFNRRRDWCSDLLKRD